MGEPRISKPVNGQGAHTRLGGLLSEQNAAPTAVTGAIGVQAPGGSVSPSDISAAASMPGLLPVPWPEITRLRQQVADDVDTVKRQARRSGALMSEADAEAAARAAVRKQVARWAQDWALKHPPLGPDELERVRTEVFNLLFLAGALQRVLDRPGVEDVLIDGELMLVDSHGRTEKLGSPFSSREQAVEWVNQMASASGHGERQLSYTTGKVDFRLPDGSRVAATVLTTHVTIAIRRHGTMLSTLRDLVERGTVDPVLATMLSCAVKAGLTMVIAGDMGTGKTTLMRALGREVPAHERLITLESDRELYLDTPDTPAHTLAFEAREGNGERDVSGRMSGQITLAELVQTSMRYKADRVMVGEVRGEEAVAMLEAMIAGGSGSMCTIHARDPESVIERLMVPLSRAGLSDQAGYRLIAAAVDLIVYIDKTDHRPRGGQMHRYVTHVWETAGRGEGGGVALARIFAPRDPQDAEPPLRADVRAMPTRTPVSERRMRKLELAGFDRRWLGAYPNGQWPEGPVT